MVVAVDEVGLTAGVDHLFGGDGLLGARAVQQQVLGRFLADLVEGVDEDVAA